MNIKRKLVIVDRRKMESGLTVKKVVNSADYYVGEDVTEKHINSLIKKGWTIELVEDK